MNSLHPVMQSQLMDSVSTLWCIDENINPMHVIGFEGVVLTNRYDIYQSVCESNIACEFNDFVLGALVENHALNTLVFHIAKEKAINIHLILEFHRLFAKGAQLHVYGEKQQGILSLSKFAQSLGGVVETIKHKGRFIEIKIISQGQDVGIAPSTYDIPVYVQNSTILCKKGVYGFNKIDKGSQLLMEAFTEEVTNRGFNSKKLTLLDLGCGYGYLSIMANKMAFKRIDATDNCAGAVKTCLENFKNFSINGTVTASNCASSIRSSYDIVVCNPPFHQGFDHSKSLIEQFVESASQHVRYSGVAFFVVNQFIGIEKYAQKYFKYSKLLIKKAGYKVYILSHSNL